MKESLPQINNANSLLKEINKIRLEANKNLAIKKKEELGQFFTDLQLLGMTLRKQS